MENDGRIEQRLELTQRHRTGAAWFFWIAGLSLVNTALTLTGSQWGFIVGLGITQLFDAIAMALAEDLGRAVTFVILVVDVTAAGVFVMFGVLAHKRYHAFYVAGMVLYALDGLLFLLVRDWLSLGFHVFALVGIYSGFRASRMLSALEREPGVAVPA